jgi:hypothetical protein
MIAKVALPVRADKSTRKSDRLSHLQAAAMALTGITAIWAIEDTAQLQPGETILIQGGAGGVAGFAIRLAKYLGATVVTTTSAANVDYVRGLGADRVVDYNADDFAKIFSDCDVVFDTVGGDGQARSYSVLKPGGRLVWVAPARPMDSVNRDRMSRYCVLQSAVTARTWSGSWHCWTLARSHRHPLRDTISRTLLKLTVSAKLVTCGASWFSPFADPHGHELAVRHWLAYCPERAIPGSLQAHCFPRAARSEKVTFHSCCVAGARRPANPLQARVELEHIARYIGGSHRRVRHCARKRPAA